MPMHDWSHVKPGTFHNFHLLWTSSITNQFNAGILPPGCFAMAEQIIGGPEPDVVALRFADSDFLVNTGNSIATVAPIRKPTTGYTMVADEDRYVGKTSQVVIKHELGKILAVIELVPGNKSSAHATRTLVDKLTLLLREGINLLVVDPFPPSIRDPQGIHGLIWSEISDQAFELPEDRRLTIAAYQASPVKTAWIEVIAVGAPLPTMPLFLHEAHFVELPLEISYQETWSHLPKELRVVVENSANS
ncbi:MAG: hypothetical protein ABL921_12205 [Pirellula sp.]